MIVFLKEEQLTWKTYKRVLKACHHPWAGGKLFHSVDMLLDIRENELMWTLAYRCKVQIHKLKKLNSLKNIKILITLSVRKLCPRAWSSQHTRSSLTRLKKESIWRSFDLCSECQSILAAPGNFRAPPLSFITFPVEILKFSFIASASQLGILKGFHFIHFHTHSPGGTFQPGNDAKKVAGSEEPDGQP